MTLVACPAPLFMATPHTPTSVPLAWLQEVVYQGTRQSCFQERVSDRQPKLSSHVHCVNDRGAVTKSTNHKSFKVRKQHSAALNIIS